MRFWSALGLVVLANTALAASFSGNSSAPKGMVTSPVAQRINAIVVPSENALRRLAEAPEDESAAKKNIDAAITKVVGQRVSMLLKIEDIQSRDGKTVLVGRIPVKSRLMWDKESELQVEMRRRDLEDAQNIKVQPPVLSTEIERIQNKIYAARQAYRAAQELADAKAQARIPDAQIDVECAEIPPGVKKGFSASLMGWIRNVEVESQVKSGITYAAIRMTVVFEKPVNAAFVATRPAPAATRPAATQAAVTTQPSTTSAE